MHWDPNNEDIYAGLTGLKLPFDEFDLGNGIVISKTYAHVFGHYMAAFKQAPKGQHHPGPWKSIGGGIAFDIWAEIYLPRETQLFKEIDRLNTTWLITALIRIKTCPFVKMPLISNMKFKNIPESQIEANFHALETESNNLFYNLIKPYEYKQDDFNWIKNNLITVGNLFEKNHKYELALLSLDRAATENRYSLGLMILWGALEQIFFPDDKQELSYRTTLIIATYLKPKGSERLTLFKKLRKLYGARSKAAHGNPTEDSEEFKQTYFILKEVFIKMTCENKIPTTIDFEKQLLVE